MSQGSGRWEVTIWFSWQQFVAGLLFVVGLLVLGFGVVRPMVSAYIGRQVSREINEAVAREVVAALVGELEGAPAPAAPAAPAADTSGAAAAAPPAPPAAGQAPAAQPQDPAAAPPAPAQPAAEAPAEQPAVNSGSILRALLSEASPTALPAPAEAQPAPAGQAAPAEAGQPAPAEAGQPAPPAGQAATAQPAQPAAPAAALPTPVVAAPITSPDPGRSIEEVVEALPSGDIPITEEQLNEKIAGRAASLGPIDRIVVRFTPGAVQVTLTVLGQDTVGTSGLAIVGGRISAQSPQLSGALALVISVNDLVRPIEDELNAIVAAAGREVKGVQIEPGKIVITMD